MRKYAQETTVSARRSKDQIEDLLFQYKTTSRRFTSCDSPPMEQVDFELNERHIRFVLRLPDKNDKQFRTTPGKNPRTRTEAQRYAAWEQEVRRLWRALLLSIKAKLEAVESGISQFDEEFLAWVVIPGTNSTVGHEIQKQLAVGYQPTGKEPLKLGYTPAEKWSAEFAEGHGENQ